MDAPACGWRVRADSSHDAGAWSASGWVQRALRRCDDARRELPSRRRYRWTPSKAIRTRQRPGSCPRRCSRLCHGGGDLAGGGERCTATGTALRIGRRSPPAGARGPFDKTRPPGHRRTGPGGALHQSSSWCKILSHLGLQNLDGRPTEFFNAQQSQNGGPGRRHDRRVLTVREVDWH
jgi:hypothetical protein